MDSRTTHTNTAEAVSLLYQGLDAGGHCQERGGYKAGCVEVSVPGQEKNSKENKKYCQKGLTEPRFGAFYSKRDIF